MFTTSDPLIQEGRYMEPGITKISDDDFLKMVLESGKPSVVDFWATWCVPCRRLDEILSETARDYGDKVSFFKMDVNESSATASKYAVRSIPMLLFFSGGEVVDHAVGSLSREILEEKLNRLLESA
jgi:thioredoxin 1